jgi:hypothetical protein
MEIRIRTTGEVLSEAAFRQSLPDTSFPTAITAVTLDGFDADVVMEGPQASGGEFWQYSVRDGVQQIGDKWYTKYSLGPTFSTQEEQTEYVAQKIIERAQAVQTNVVAETQKRLDDFAKTRNYDGILSLATYATSTNTTFATEGQYGVEARDATWAMLYTILAEVQAGTRPMPTGYSDIEAELPTLSWPE